MKQILLTSIGLSIGTLGHAPAILGFFSYHNVQVTGSIVCYNR